MDKQPFKIVISNSKNIHLDSYKFIFSQAEKYLDDTVKTGETIAVKNSVFVTLLVAIITSCCAYLLKEYDGLNKINNKEIIALTAILYSFLLCWLMGKNIFPNSYFISGTNPKTFFVDSVFVDDKSEVQQKIIYKNLIEGYQKRIDTNRNTNDKRWKKFKKTIYALFFMPFVLVGLFIVLELCRHQG